MLRLAPRTQMRILGGHRRSQTVCHELLENGREDRTPVRAIRLGRFRSCRDCLSIPVVGPWANYQTRTHKVMDAVSVTSKIPLGYSAH